MLAKMPCQHNTIDVRVNKGGKIWWDVKGTKPDMKRYGFGLKKD